MNTISATATLVRTGPWMSSVIRALAGLMLLVIASVNPALAAEPSLVGPYDVNVGHGLTFTGNKTDAPAPLAVRGYDVVSYFTDGKPRLGTSDHAVLHNGAIYWFATDEHKVMFVADPSHYLPQYGGFCAFGVTQSTKFDGDPLLWNVHKGKLYLNVTPALQQKWLGKGLVNVVGDSLEQNVAEADRIWARIAGAKPQALFEAWAAKQ